MSTENVKFENKRWLLVLYRWGAEQRSTEFCKGSWINLKWKRYCVLDKPFHYQTTCVRRSLMGKYICYVCMELDCYGRGADTLDLMAYHVFRFHIYEVLTWYEYRQEARLASRSPRSLRIYLSTKHTCNFSLLGYAPRSDSDKIWGITNINSVELLGTHSAHTC